MSPLQRSVVFPSTLALLFLIGCRSASPERAFQGTRAGGLRFAVENHNFLDVTVYARVAGGSSFRLGEVTGNSTAQFTLERWQLPARPGIRIFVDPLGGAQGFLSRLIFPDPATGVFVHVAQSLELSYVILR